VIAVIVETVRVLLLVIQFAMMARAILSWFPIEPNKLTQLLDAITEPLIYPIRKLFEKMNWFQDIPLDMSFMATYLILVILIMFLP
jgi:uncharacterized protein YggT (Ycf19 family)